MMLVCPNCKKPLLLKETYFLCSQGHSFDCGKNGDVNLLLASQKRSKNPGDSKAMITARREFLSAGVYQPIAERLAGIVTLLSQGEPKVIADAGCGEGYYLRQIQRLAYPNLNYFFTNGGHFIGWDISKFAVQSAARQYSNHRLNSTYTLDQLAVTATWLTASNASIPLGNNSVDILFSGFGFEVASEFCRILKPAGQGGFLITLDAGEQHLIQLREIIYDEIKQYNEKELIGNDEFQLVKQQSMNYQTEINQQQIAQLMVMTPHLYRASAAGKQRLAELTELPLTIDVICRIYQKK